MNSIWTKQEGIRKLIFRMVSWTFGLLLFAAVISIVSSQCPTPREINGGAGEFQSPNFGSEYGKKADCAWRFNSSSLTKYALKLDVKMLRLYLIQNGGKVCVNGSYNLSINGALVDCIKFARETFGITFCHAYYNNVACKSLSDVTGCEVSRKTKFPVNVEYNADGRTVTDDSVSIMYGFKIGYQFIQCPDITTKPEAKTSLPIETTQAGGHQTSTVGDIGLTIHGIRMTSSQMKETPSTKVTTEIKGSKVIEYRDNPTTIAAAFIGGFALAILVGAIVYIVKRYQSNRNQKAKGQIEAAPANSAADQTYEQVNNPNATNNFTLEENSAYEATNASGPQEIILEENPGYDNPNLSNSQQIASDYESVNYNAPHLYERPK